MNFPPGIKEHVYQLRAQGNSTRGIQALLVERFPGERCPDHETIRRWLQDPDAAALVRQDEARIRATAAIESAELVPLAYDKLRDALQAGDLKSADAGSRVIVNLTRGFVQERLEVSPDRKVDALEELASIAARHGLRIGETTTAKSGDTES